MTYYDDQSDWTSDDFYCLHRYLHKMLFYNKKRMDEIRAIDLNRMSAETKAIMYCIISYYHMDYLFELENLRGLSHCQPLKRPLIIDGDTAKEDDVYKKMNIIF